MGRPAKSVKVATGARSAEEVAIRQEIEETLRGGPGKPEPPEWLNEDQRALFLRIVTQYMDADILAALDAVSLAQFCVAVDRLQYIETEINRDPDLLNNREFMNARRGYESTMWRGCTEFCLSPQARAKIGSLAAARLRDSEDPLAAALR